MINLLTESLWRDEAFSALLVRHNPLEIIQLSSADSTPPLYYLLLHYWSLLFGDSEVALRSLSVIGWIGTVGVMFLIGKRISRSTGWWLAGLALSQPLLFRYAFEARAYSLLVFLTTLTIYLYLSKRYRLLAVSAAALLYSHLFGGWVVLILGGWMLYKKEPWWWLGLPLIAILPWVPNYLNVASISGNFLAPPDLADLRLKLILIGSPILMVLLPKLKELWKTDLFRLYGALWVLPIVGTFVFSQFKPIFLERYLIEVVPIQLLLVGLIMTKKYWRYLGPIVVIVQVIICAQIFVGHNKAPIRDLADYIKASSRPGDQVIDGTSLTYFESIYYGLNGKIYSPEKGYAGVPYYIGRIIIPEADVVTKLPPAQRYWLINTSEGGGTLQQPFPAKFISTYSFSTLKLSLYEAN